MSLNQEQMEAVACDGHTLVVAPPGSGKTKLSVDKIARLLQLHPGATIGAVTFTRDSAKELKGRVEKVVGAAVAERQVIIGTFHSVAIKQMKSARKNIKLIGGAEQRGMILRALQESGLTHLKLEDATRMIEETKTSINLISETLDGEKLYQYYQTLLDSHGACDMQDLVRLAVKGMSDGSIAPLQVKHLIIDEYQDTDEIQYQWAMLHAQAGVAITVVGDDDQSIYGWRHALGYGGMMQFKDVLAATQVTLKSNYRSKREILDYATALIRKNADRVEKQLIAENGPGGRVQCFRCDDREDEGVKLAKFVKGLPGRWHDDGGVQIWKVQAKSTVVLARSNQLLRTIANELAAEQIDYRLGAGKDIWATPPLSYLVGLLDGYSKNSTLGLELALSWIGHSGMVVNHIHTHANGKLSRLARVPEIMEDIEPDSAMRKQANEIVALAQGWQLQLKNGRLQQVIISASQWVSNGVKKHRDRELLLIGTRILAERLKGTLGERLKLVTRKRDEDDGDEECVKLMTMHGSKGLEYDYVWVMAVEEGVIPSVPLEGEPAPIDEERRLLYVAMTRAKKELVLSYMLKPSLFLQECNLLTLADKAATQKNESLLC